MKKIDPTIKHNNMINNFIEYLENKNPKNVLLVEPNFPIPNKSRNHSNFLPIGLLKIASLLRKHNINVKLIRFNQQSEQTLLLPDENINPDIIFISTIFTYWSKYVKEAVDYYRKTYPITTIIGGGGVCLIITQTFKRILWI